MVLAAAEVNLDLAARARGMFDPAGQHARPDVLTLHVDTTPRQAVTMAEAAPGEDPEHP